MEAYPGYKAVYNRYLALLEEALPSCIPGDASAQRQVEEAMAYSLLGGGKRLRGVLTLAFCELFGGEPRVALPLACAVEMVHAYSLIHDDLPCMDNDDLRRGKPTCHIAYGEAMALLAGDALLTHAFQTILTARLPDDRLVAAVGILSSAAGTRGMIGGQVIDIESEGRMITPDLLDQIHSLKTGALIRAAAALGCCAAGAEENHSLAADRYAAALGLLFQVTDDLLDVTSTTQQLGKPVGSDQKSSKTTYATLYGVEASRETAVRLAGQAKEELEVYGDGSLFLRELAEHTVTRTK